MTIESRHVINEKEKNAILLDYLRDFAVPFPIKFKEKRPKIIEEINKSLKYSVTIFRGHDNYLRPTFALYLLTGGQKEYISITVSRLIDIYFQHDHEFLTITDINTPFVLVSHGVGEMRNKLKPDAVIHLASNRAMLMGKRTIFYDTTYTLKSMLEQNNTIKNSMYCIDIGEIISGKKTLEVDLVD